MIFRIEFLQELECKQKLTEILRLCFMKWQMQEYRQKIKLHVHVMFQSTLIIRSLLKYLTWLIPFCTCRLYLSEKWNECDIMVRSPVLPFTQWMESRMLYINLCIPLIHWEGTESFFVHIWIETSRFVELVNILE